MNWYTIFYFFSLADKISSTMLFMAVLFSIMVVLGWIFYGIGRLSFRMEHNELPVSWILAKYGGMFMFLAWFLWAFIPDRKDMTMIVAGGSVGQYIINDENAKELPKDVTRFLRKEILEATADISSDIKSELNIKTKKDSLLELSKEELVKLLEQ